MKKANFFVLFALVCLFFPSLTLADGMIVSPPNYYMYETEQKAVIFYEKGIEDLIISIQVSGNAKDFAWIIPTPARPKVSKSFDSLFSSLADLTRVNYNYEQPQPMYLGLGDTGSVKQGVEVIETKQIDYYDITVLAATESNDLYKWLNSHGYKFPQSATYILDNYIDMNWYFTAVKVDSKYLSNNLNEQLRSGHAIPLKLTFSSNKIVYPLKISSVNTSYQEPLNQNQAEIMIDGNTQSSRTAVVSKKIAYPSPPESVNLLIYVFADHKQEVPNFQTLYASWLTKDEIENLAFTDNGQPWKKLSGEKYYLTKLQRQMSTSEMTSDLFFKQADNDDSVNAPENILNSGIALTIILSFGGIITVVLLILLIWLIIKK